MSQPITITETEAREYRTVEREYTYDELLDLFDEGTLVRPLVLRCQEHEAEIERLRGELAEAREKVQWSRAVCESALRESDGEEAKLRGQFGRLLSAVRCYCDADPAVRGEAYRDLTGTLDAIDFPDAEKYGWPQCYARVERERDDARRELAELRAVVLEVACSLDCRCDECWTGRGLHSPDCLFYLAAQLREAAQASKEKTP